MTTREPETNQTAAEQPAPTAETPAFEPEAPPRRGWRDRMRGLTGRDRISGLRGSVAVGLAGLVLGGVGGFALHAATDDHGRPDFRGGPGGFGQPYGGDGDDDPRGHGVPGQLPPATNPDDGTQPDQSGDSASGSTNS